MPIDKERKKHCLEELNEEDVKKVVDSIENFFLDLGQKTGLSFNLSRFNRNGRFSKYEMRGNPHIRDDVPVLNTYISVEMYRKPSEPSVRWTINNSFLDGSGMGFFQEAAHNYDMPVFDDDERF